MSRTRRWAGGLGLLLVGVVVGIAGAFVQAQRILVDLPWGTEPLPWGVPVVWVALVIAVRGGVWALRSRRGGWAVAAGWLVGTVLLSTESPSGDLALSGGGRQMTYLVGGVILASAAATIGLPYRPAACEPGAAEGTPGDVRSSD